MTRRTSKTVGTHTVDSRIPCHAKIDLREVITAADVVDVNLAILER